MIDAILGVERWLSFEQSTARLQLLVPRVDILHNQGQDQTIDLGGLALTLAETQKCIARNAIYATVSLIESELETQHTFIEPSRCYEIARVEECDLLING
jgi:hypothetical protein